MRVDVEGAANDLSVGSELTFGVSVAHEDDARSFGDLIGGGEPSALDRLHAEGLKYPIGHDRGPHFFGLFDTGDRCRRRIPGAEVRKAAVLFAVREEHGSREPQAAGHGGQSFGSGCGLPDRDELLGVWVCERLEQDAVDDAEHRGVRADADCQRQDHHSGERGRPPQRP